ncbi:MAG: hypothetical protein R3E86_05765 [Pseudomonadales bacterium]
MSIRPIVTSQIFGLAGITCLGLGIAGLSGSGASLHAALGDESVAWGLSAAGAVLIVIEMRLLIPALRARAAGTRTSDQNRRG